MAARAGVGGAPRALRASRGESGERAAAGVAAAGAAAGAGAGGIAAGGWGRWGWGAVIRMMMGAVVVLRSHGDDDDVSETAIIFYL